MGFFGWLFRKMLGVDEPRPLVDQPPTSASSSSAPRRAANLNLDAGDFLPIGREELRSGAQQNRGWGNPWFGRRDLIPPAADERTKLIDRGLVTQGLLTPEQLV